MKALLFFFLFAFTSLFAQKFDINLKNLDKVKIKISDNSDQLSSGTIQKLKTEIKLKLLSAGIKVSDEDNVTSRLYITVEWIKSNFAEHRVLVQFQLFEKVKPIRKGNIETDAITYFDHELFPAKNVPQSVYDTLMDRMVLNFIEKYLSDKNS